MLGVDEHRELKTFNAEDFDAYLPQKWNSNMFTLGRRKVKGKLDVIGQDLTRVLEKAGLSLVKYLSDEFPSLWNKKSVDTQWLFFSRDEAARTELSDLIDHERTLADTLLDPTPRYRHIFIGISVNQDYLEIGLRLHHDAWVDRKNLINLLRTKEGLARFRQVICDLPEHYEVKLTGDDLYSPPDLDEDTIIRIAESFEAERKRLFIGAKLPRDQVLILGADVIDVATEVFGFLVPVYKVCAWSPENDAISLERLVAERHEAIEASHKELEREKAEREEDRRQRDMLGQKLREEIEEKVFQTEEWRRREYAARRAAAARAEIVAKQDDPRARAEANAAKWKLSDAKDIKPIAGPIAGAPEIKKPKEPVERGEIRPAQQVVPKKDTETQDKQKKNYQSQKHKDQQHKDHQKNISVGDTVEVRRGFLKRKRGVVQEIDEKGTVKINFGALSSRLTLDDIQGLFPVVREGKQQ